MPGGGGGGGGGGGPGPYALVTVPGIVLARQHLSRAELRDKRFFSAMQSAALGS